MQSQMQRELGRRTGEQLNVCAEVMVGCQRSPARYLLPALRGSRCFQCVDTQNPTGFRPGRSSAL